MINLKKYLMNFKQKPTAFVGAYYRTREQLGAALLGNAIQGNAAAVFAGKSFSAKSADQIGLFNTGHTSITGEYTNQSNRFTNAFSDSALSLAETAMQSFRDDNGNVLAVNPDTIIIPNIASLKKTVFAAIGADKDPATSNNGFNYHFGRWNVIVWAYLNQFIGSETAPWILMSSNYNKENGGALWYDRVGLSVASYIDENTDDITKMMLCDLNCWFEGDIMLNAEKMSKAAGIEARTPFLDSRLYNIACHIPSEYKVSLEESKIVFRKAAANMIPDEVAFRKKLGFAVPART